MPKRHSHKRKRVEYKYKGSDSEPEDSSDEDESNIHVNGNAIYFYSSISTKSVMNLLKTVHNVTNEMLYTSTRYNFEPHIELHIQSGGGDLFAGFSAYDNLCWL